jgi:hypothetical protein
LLLTEPNKNEPNPAIKPSMDDREAGQPSTGGKKPLSKYEQKMAKYSSDLRRLSFNNRLKHSWNKPFQRLRMGNVDSLTPSRGVAFHMTRDALDLVPQHYKHCAINPSRGSNQGSIGWYGTSDQSMENPNTDDSKPKGGETGRIFMMSHTKPTSSQENHTKVEKPNVDISFPHSVVEGMMLKQLGLSHGATTINMPFSSHSSLLRDGAKTHIFTN